MISLFWLLASVSVSATFFLSEWRSSCKAAATAGSASGGTAEGAWLAWSEVLQLHRVCLPLFGLPLTSAISATFDALVFVVLSALAAAFAALLCYKTPEATGSGRLICCLRRGLFISIPQPSALSSGEKKNVYFLFSISKASPQRRCFFRALEAAAFCGLRFCWRKSLPSPLPWVLV